MSDGDVVVASHLNELTPPFYVFDMSKLEGTFQAFSEAFRRRFERVEVGYSYKTNHVPYLLRRLHEWGARAEVVSALELRLAESLGVPGERIIFNGPGKSPDELAHGLEAGALVHLDSLQEVEDVAAWGGAHPLAGARAGLRVNFSWPPDDGQSSRFGIARGPDLSLAATTLANAPGVEFAGLHGHVSSRTRSREQYYSLAHELAAAAVGLGMTPPVSIDVGGGFGMAPPEMEALSFPSFDDYAEAISEGLAGALSREDFTLIVEPGIAVVGSCASYYASVLALKRIQQKNLVVLDASVQTVKPTRHRHNLPTVALDADFRPLDGTAELYDLVGYTCMEDDVIGEDVELPRLSRGDVLRIDNVGAYTLVFKPPFIRGCPAMYAKEPDGYVLIRAAEGLGDVFRG